MKPKHCRAVKAFVQICLLASASVYLCVTHLFFLTQKHDMDATEPGLTCQVANLECWGYYGLSRVPFGCLGNVLPCVSPVF